MRSAGNFSPEWGYLAPAPSFMRTARVVLVATAVGATAGAGVVLSLADRPAADGVKTSIAAHAIVTSAQAATPAASSAPMAAAVLTNVTASTPSPAPAQIAAQTPAQTPVQAAPQAAPQIQAEKSMPLQPSAASQPVANQSAAIVPAQPSAVGVSTDNFSANAANAAPAPPVPGIAALSTGAASTDAAPTDTPDATAVAPEQGPPQKKTKHSASKNKPAPGFGSVIRRLFTAHAGPSYYPNRGL
jgi:general secretion pathway protein B